MRGSYWFKAKSKKVLFEFSMLQIGADNEPVVDFLPTIDVQPFQGRGGLAL